MGTVSVNAEVEGRLLGQRGHEGTAARVDDSGASRRLNRKREFPKSFSRPANLAIEQKQNRPEGTPNAARRLAFQKPVSIK